MADFGVYELGWPREVFVAEAEALLAAGYPDGDLGFLLDEAFVGGGPARDFAQTPAAGLKELIRVADQLPLSPKLHVQPGSVAEPDFAGVEAAFGTLLGKLDGYGYLDRFPPRERARIVERSTGAVGIWPVESSRSRWAPSAGGNADLLLVLIDAVTALVARPRSRDRPSGYGVETGQALYRAHITRDLVRCGVIGMRWGRR